MYYTQEEVRWSNGFVIIENDKDTNMIIYDIFNHAINYESVLLYILRHSSNYIKAKTNHSAPIVLVSSQQKWSLWSKISVPMVTDPVNTNLIWLYPHASLSLFGTSKVLLALQNSEMNTFQNLNNGWLDSLSLLKGGNIANKWCHFGQHWFTRSLMTFILTSSNTHAQCIWSVE